MPKSLLYVDDKEKQTYLIRSSGKLTFITPLIALITVSTVSFLLFQAIPITPIGWYGFGIISNLVQGHITAKSHLRHELKHIYVFLLLKKLIDKKMIDLSIEEASKLVGFEHGMPLISKEKINIKELEKIENRVINAFFKGKKEAIKIDSIKKIKRIANIQKTISIILIFLIVGGIPFFTIKPFQKWILKKYALYIVREINQKPINEENIQVEFREGKIYIHVIEESEKAPYGDNYSQIIHENHGIFAYLNEETKVFEPEINKLLSVLPKEMFNSVKTICTIGFAPDLERELEEKEKIEGTQAAGISFLDRKIILIKKPYISHVPFYGFSRALLHEMSHLWLTNPYQPDSYVVNRWAERFGGYEYPHTEDEIVEKNTSWISDTKGFIKFAEGKSAKYKEKVLFIASLHLHNSYLRIYKGWGEYRDVKIDVPKGGLTLDFIKKVVEGTQEKPTSETDLLQLQKEIRGLERKRWRSETRRRERQPDLWTLNELRELRYGVRSIQRGL